MSMLADRRRKTRYVLNPTKKPLWTTDSSGIKFGKELMEKMGWSAGKGLGANEQGIQEPLKVSYKNDSKGMGYKGNEENWIEYQDEFNCLLNQLASNTENSIKTKEAEKNEVMSLEEKSKLSKARVHYQKFTRGKDISKYSENDLSCILGTGKMKKANNETVFEKETPPENNVQETSFGITTINSGSLKDYFKKKWTFNNLKYTNSNIQQPHSVLDEEQQFNEETNASLEKSSRKRQREGKEESLKDRFGNEGNEYTESEIKRHKKKKKKWDLEEEISIEKGRKTYTEIDVEIQNNEKNQSEDDNLPENISTDSIKDGLKPKKKKKKKRECEEVNELEPRDGESSEVLIVEKKSKKRKKEKEAKVKSVEKSLYEGEVNGNITEEEPQKETQKENTKKKKTKAEEKAEKSLDIVNNFEIGVNKENVAEEIENNTEVAAEEKSRKKKKKKKNIEKNAEFQDNNTNNCEEQAEDQKSQLEDSIEEKRVKKKKKKKEKGENLELEGLTNGEEDSREKLQNKANLNKKEKKKKKKHLEEPEKGQEEEEEEEVSKESLDIKVAAEIPLTEKKRKEKNKENTEIQCQPELMTKKSRKNKKEKKREESENKGNQLEVNILESQEKVFKKKDKTKSKSCSETMDISETYNGTGNEVSNNKEEKNINGEIESMSEVGVTLVHTHKIALFQMKKPFMNDFKKCTTAEALNLICGADIKKFKGANLENLPGYGYKKTIKENVDR